MRPMCGNAGVYGSATLLLLGLAVPTTAEVSTEPLPARYTETVMTERGEEISFDMVLAPGGTFWMGSPGDEPGRKQDEGPRHEVRMSPFYLASTETSLELFLSYYRETKRSKDMEPARTGEPGGDQPDAVTGPTPVYGDLTMGRGQDHPAAGMTWENAVSFCRWLSQKTGKNYRLPTEAEWEYACRAGSGENSAAGEVAEEAVWFEENSDGAPRAVAQGAPNPGGFHDMLGNVREWVADFYSASVYSDRASQQPAVDPTGPESGRVRAARGGDYRSPASQVRCAARGHEEDWWRSLDPQLPHSRWWLPMMDHIGFRVAVSAQD